LTPKKLKYCLEGHRLKKKIDDESMWNWFGNYAISAFIVAIDIAFNGKKSKAEYIDLPLLATEEEREERTSSPETTRRVFAHASWNAEKF